jgi:molybdenum cofactor cytidylyltransferase
MIRSVGILLAAGRGSRFGGDKLLARLPDPAGDAPAGTPLGVAAAINLVHALERVIAVVRPGDAELAAQFRAVGVETFECPDSSLGMGASLACAVSAARDAGGWIVALADMPWIKPATTRAVAAALAAGAEIVAPAYRGERGHPVGFAGMHRDALLACSGDAGARELIAQHRTRLTLVDVDDPGVLRDVDFREQVTGGRDEG